MMVRQADTETYRQNHGASERHLVSKAYELGHWEAMQIVIALETLADSHFGSLREQMHTRALARILVQDATYTITVNYPEF